MINKKYIFLPAFFLCILLFSCTKEGTQNHLFLHAYFKADQTKVLAGDTVQFQDYSIGHPQRWQWTFEGGTPARSTEQNPKVVYKKTGAFKVSLVVRTTGDTASRKQGAYINVVSTSPSDKNRVAYFPFNNSPSDEGPAQVAIQNHGSVQFNGTDRHGENNSAAVFDGNSLLIVPDNEVLNFGTHDFTISCWIQTSHTEKMMVWQESGAEGSRDNQAWLRIGDNTSDRLVRFDTEDGGGGNIINYGDGPSTALSDGKWHFIVCVRSGGTTRLYIDGDQKEEMIKGSPKAVSNTEDFKIGGQEGPAGTYHTFYTGMIDDLAFYNKALDAEEIAALYLK